MTEHLLPSLFSFFIFHSSFFKLLYPFVELGEGSGTELSEGGTGLVNGLFPVELRLGEELVGVADDLLLEGFGTVVLQGKGEVLLPDVLDGDSCAGVARTDTCVAGKAFLQKQFGTEKSVTDVWFRSEALDAVGIAEEDSYVVEHGCLFDEFLVEVPFGMVLCYT